MFDNIPVAPKDQIFSLIQQYNHDANPNKINLLSGVYRDAAGQVPILKSVQLAEAELLRDEKSKDYLDIEGDDQFRERIPSLLGLKDIHSNVIQTPGGTGALRLVAELIHQFSPDAAVWIPNPTWINHHNIFQAAEVKIQEYPYYDSSKKEIPFEQLISTLKNAKAGDFLLLHACCHNPTGCDFSKEQWKELLNTVSKLSLIPIFDNAYQGFASGFVEDAYPIQLFSDNGVELFIASSFSKNFGLYNERIGALTITAKSKELCDNIFGNLKYIVRGIYSNPPAHGAKIIYKILSTQLVSQWEKDLLEMNNRLKEMRHVFSKMLSEKTGRDFFYIEKQNGLFSFIDIKPDHVLTLREKHGIYLLNSGRINVTGINNQNVDCICESIKNVISK